MPVRSSNVVKGSMLAGAELAWFLLFPSLGIVQKYLGTTGAYAYFGIGGLLLTVGVRGLTMASEVKATGQPWARRAMAALFVGLAVALGVIYASAGNGNDRG